MPALFLSILSSAVVAATPLTPQPWFEFKDYPMDAFEKSWEGLTRFQLLIAPDGRIASCSITGSSGHPSLDEKTCYLATKRAKFSPASGPDGARAWGVYRSQAAWLLPEHRMLGADPGPDLEISVEKLPAGTAQPPVVKLAYAVDSQGNPSSCSPMRNAQAQPQVLVDTGCAQLLQKIGKQPVVDPAGQPVAAVRTAAVRFSAPQD